MKKLYGAWIFVLFLGILAFPQLDYATVYRWKDAQGKIHYSSALPPNKVYDLEIKQGNSWVRYSGQKPLPRRSTPQVRAVLNYSTYRSVIVIPVTINQALDTQFAVDTGASYTILSPAAAQTLKLHPNPEIPPLTLHTASPQCRGHDRVCGCHCRPFSLHSSGTGLDRLLDFALSESAEPLA